MSLIWPNRKKCFRFGSLPVHLLLALLLKECFAMDEVAASLGASSAYLSSPSPDVMVVTTVKPVCCLDVESKHKHLRSVILFKESTLSKCQKVLVIRKQSNLKHSSVVLPSEVDGVHGFHLECYRKFVSLPAKHRSKIVSEFTDKDSIKLTTTTRSAAGSFPKPSTRTGVFPNTCIFCNQSRKKLRGAEQQLLNAKTQNFEKCIRKYVQWMKDHKLEARLNGINFAVKEVKYHSICRVQYQNKAKAAHKKAAEITEGVPLGHWHAVRESNKKAFEALKFYIHDSVILKKKMLLMASIAEYYQHLLLEIGGEEFREERFKNAAILREKLEGHFKSEIVIEKISRRQRVIYASSVTKPQIEKMKESLLSSLDIEGTVRNTALTLREEILSISTKPLPEDITVEDVVSGEAEIPNLISTFFRLLIAGPDPRNWNQPLKSKRIEAICEDVIFSTTAGRLKPKKHLMLGVVAKSMTGSRKLIEILNKLGHCASYHTLEEIETEMAYHSRKDFRVTPFGMACQADLATGVAWDNFDRFVDTPNGKDTLHDTVGIVYQCVPQELGSTSENVTREGLASGEVLPVPGRRKRRRTFEAIGVDIVPYRKQPKMSNFQFLPEDDEKRQKPETADMMEFNSWKKDFLWMAGFRSNLTQPLPMWTGWNSHVTEDRQGLQKIWYLPQINQSPTSNAVVAETLRRSLEIAAEAGRKSIAVTYDLAIARMALRIQGDESPKYDSVFISLGAFHIELSFLKALGKIVAESGGPYVLNECGVLAHGSLNSFYQGKHYKRCKRVHEILALSLESLHFKQFLCQCEDEEELEIIIHNEICKIEGKKDSDFAFSKEFSTLLKRYRLFCEQTYHGGHGKTAKFWIQYINLFHIYHSFVRSTRSGDFDLYVATLPQITDCFFALNHINYARWMTKYYDNLLKISETHTEVANDFKKGLFAIKRTGTSFSATPVDLTLEQTINADSASQRHGTRALSNSIAARQRWAESHFIRSIISSKLLTELGMSKGENISNDLKASVISYSNEKVKKVMDMLSETLNPFSVSVDKEHLFNIVTGKAVSTTTEGFLLNFLELGKRKRLQFVRECVSDPSRFDQRIERTKVATFATDAAKNRSSLQSQKYESACLIRDIFGKLLHQAIGKKIDLGIVFQYPLTPVPLSLSHVDGSMQKTSKSSLMKYLESQVKTTPPQVIDVLIVDAMFFLHVHQQLPPTFGGVAQYLMKRISEFDGKTVHFVSDKWLKPSIKDAERQLRVETSAHYEIRGPAQKRPSNWTSVLCNASFKESLIAFLIDIWQDDSFANLLGSKTLFANSGDRCFKYFAMNDKMHRQEAVEYYCTHEEADCRMFYHLARIDTPSNVVIRTSDTDCLVIALGSMHLFQIDHKIWLEVGVQRNNSQRYVSINQIQIHLGSSVCKAMLFYHAFTGCDYTSAFCRKGKVMPLKVLQKDLDIQRTFSGLLAEAEVSSAITSVVEKYVCLIYGKKNIVSVNELRHLMFNEKYRPKRLTSYKKLDGCMMPPCFKVLFQKIKRAHLVARRWWSATSSFPPCDDPENSGWQRVDNEFAMVWFDGEAMPSILEIDFQDDSDEAVPNEDGDSSESSDSSDTEMYM